MIEQIEQAGQAKEKSPLLQIGRITELEEYSARLIAMRWLAGVLVLLATAVSLYGLRLTIPGRQLYAVGIVVLLSNAVLTICHRRLQTADRESTRRAARRFVQIQIALDWVLLTIFLHLTGGITSPAIPVLLIHMVMAAMLLPELPPVFFMAIGVLVLAGLAVLERAGVLPHYQIMPIVPDRLHAQPVFIASQLGFIILTATGAQPSISRANSQALGKTSSASTA